MLFMEAGGNIRPQPQQRGAGDLLHQHGWLRPSEVSLRILSFGDRLLGRDCSVSSFCLEMGNSLPAVMQSWLLRLFQKLTDARAASLLQVPEAGQNQ